MEDVTFVEAILRILIVLVSQITVISFIVLVFLFIKKLLLKIKDFFNQKNKIDKEGIK